MCKYLPTKNPLSGRAGQTVPQDSNIFDLLWKKFCLVWAISGAGKSTLIHYVLSQLDANCYKPSLVHYGGLQRNGMLKAIADVLGVDTNGRTVPLLISLQKQITNMHRSTAAYFRYLLLMMRISWKKNH